MEPDVEERAGSPQRRPAPASPDSSVPAVSFASAAPVRRPSARARSLLPFAPAVALGVMWLLWVGADGGYYPQSWYPSTLVALAVLAGTAALNGRLLPRDPLARLALLAFAGLTALNYLSILWARSPAGALDASNQLLLYLAVSWAISLLPWTPQAMTLLLAGFSIGIAVFCAAGLLEAHAASSLNGYFVDLRYSRPMAYPNATSALAIFGLWPGLVISARRDTSAWLRPPLLGVAAFLAAFSLLPQSRGALLGMVVVAPLLVVVAGWRVRLVLRMLVTGAAIAFVAPRTVAVDRAVSAGHRVEPYLARASLAMLWVALAAAVLGVGLIVIESRFERTALAGRGLALRRSTRFRRVAGAALVVGMAIAVIVALPALTHLTRTVISSGRSDAATGHTRILSASPEERFDYDRVALQLFRAHPLVGAGAGNFGIFYDAAKRFSKHSLYVHNLPLRVLSETGLAGAVLFLALLVSTLLGLWRTARRAGASARAGCAVAFSVAAYFLLHASLDWLEQFPALAAAALALPLAAIAQAQGADRMPSGPGPSGAAGPVGRLAPRSRGVTIFRRRAPVAAGVLALAGSSLLVGAPYLAQRYVARASQTALAAPEQAYTELRLAHRLNPLSATPYATAGSIALQLGESAHARAEFSSAVAADGDWYSRVEVALIDAAAGRRVLALQEMRAAIALDRSDPALLAVAARISAGRPPSPVALEQLLIDNTPASIFKEQTVR